MFINDGKRFGSRQALKTFCSRCLRRMGPVAFLLLSGCVVPSGTTYYVPTMDGGHAIQQSSCMQVKSVIEFGQLPLQVLVQRAANGSLVGSVKLPMQKPYHPAWQSFYFKTSKFYVRDSANGPKKPVKSVKVFRNDQVKSMLEPYYSTTGKHWFYFIDIVLPDMDGKGFDLFLPPVVIDGHERHYPPIHFEKKVWVGLSPFNC